MIRLSTLTAAAVIAASTMLAQQATTEAAALKSSYNGIKNNLTKAAEKAPESDYDFKPVPEIRTLGALIAHIADAQAFTCAAVAGGQRPSSASSKTTKADLVAALKASFETCDPVFESLTDADATKMVSMGRGGQRSKFASLWGLIAHSNEEYGYLSVYLRLKGIVPPSTSDRGR